MTKTSYYRLTDTVQKVGIGGLTVQTTLAVSGMILALSYSSEDCDKPVRAWLIANASVSVALFFLYFWKKKTCFVAWVVWNITFAVLAAAWTFGDDSCENDYSYGFATMNILAIVSLFMLATIVIAACVAGIAVGIGYGLMNDYEEVE
jgi:hypothetical protein